MFRQRIPEVKQNPADIKQLYILYMRHDYLNSIIQVLVIMIDYQPFEYPPNYEIAAVHQQSTMPGKIRDHKIGESIDGQKYEQCPCCQEPLKMPLSSWRNRSITQDFKYYGGAVVSYFWLIKLYAIITALILIIYSGFLFFCTIKYCDADKCQKFMFFIWVVSNDQLYQIMKQSYHENQDQYLYILFTLRTVAYVILIAGNTAALYIVARYKRRYPKNHTIQKYSLIFKNIPNNSSTQDLYLELQSHFPQMKLEQIFQLKKMQPYYSLYDQKLTLYYESLIEANPKKQRNLLTKLYAVDKLACASQKDYCSRSDRIIVVFQSEQVRDRVLEMYRNNEILYAFKYLFGVENSMKMYCQPCPIPEQIIWNNIGQHEGQKVKYKILSVLYFLLLVGLSYLILYFCLEVVYKRLLDQPWNFIVTNIILFFMVYMALTFRQLMNRLSQLRYPNTQTSRTLFIVLTTVVFHFIFYLIIPTIYLQLPNNKQQNLTLVFITNQIFNFMLVQFILVGTDFVYSTWKKGKKKVEDVDRPVGCQKILHRMYEYPRFPIEFKLIILFKIFSFITLTAFQTPSMLIFIFLFLLYAYWTDKKAIYYHYRMEIIDNTVQYMFLKIYSNLYTIYIFITFTLTQHMQFEFWGAFVIMVIAIIIQIFYIKQNEVNQESLKEQLGIIGLGNKAKNYRKMREKQGSMISESGEHRDSYKKRYDDFMKNITNDKLDMEIKEYLANNGLASISTESQEIGKQRLL